MWMKFFKGYDKLKPFGFSIHGAICGYSRRVLWLEVMRSNKDPHVIAEIFLHAVKEFGGCPKQVRTDCGTENVLLCAMQCYLRADGNDDCAGEKAHVYGSSPANQRIEAWWSYLRRNRSGWWIDFFQDMLQHGILEIGNTLHMEALWFCFNQILQDDLCKVKDHWNSHYIRKSHNETMSGIPDILYFLPEYYGGVECLMEISHAKLIEMEEKINTRIFENLYKDYFEYVLETSGLFYPESIAEAFEMFHFLINIQ